MLYQPTNIYPSVFGQIGNGVIDARERLDVSWQVNGNSAMTAFRITIYENTATSNVLYSSGKLSDNCPFYGVDYAGNINFFSYSIPASTLAYHGIVNGASYKIGITAWWGDSPDDYVTLSSENVFYAKQKPTLRISNLLDKIPAWEYTFTAQYSQADNEALNWVRWRFASASDSGYEVLSDTGNIYGTSQLRFTRDGMINGNRYAIRCTVQTQSGVEVDTGWNDFTASYTMKPISGTLSACQSRKGSGIKLTMPKTQSIPATISGKYAISDSYLHLDIEPSAAAKWSTVDGEAMNFQAPLDIAWRGKWDSNGYGTIRVEGEAVGFGLHSEEILLSSTSSICFGAGKFVVINQGEFAYSADLTVWQSGSLPKVDSSTHGYYSVCYGNGKFVAVGGNTAAYSEDGVTWTAVAFPLSGQYGQVCYGNGKFVAVSRESGSAYSTDGISWVAGDLSAERNWNNVCAGDNLFVASCIDSAASGTPFAYSSDGMTWETSDAVPYITVWGLAYGNGIYVAVGWTWGCATSTDGKTWTPHGVSFNFNCVTFAEGLFFAQADYGWNSVWKSAFVISEDGIQWSTFDSPVSGHSFRNAAYGNGSFVSAAGKYIVYSTNDVVQSAFLQIQVSSGSNNMHIETPWQKIDQSITAQADSSIVYDGEHVYASGLSADSYGWTESTIQYEGTTTAITGGQWSPVVYGELKATGDNKYVTACYVDALYAAQSDDLQTWTISKVAGPAVAIMDACYGDEKFVFLAYDGNVLYTEDFSFIGLATLDASLSWSRIVYGNGIFVALPAESNVCVYSSDAITWNTASLPVTAAWSDICFGGGKFVLVSNANKSCLYSANGSDWSTSLMENFRPSNVSYDGSKFVFAGDFYDSQDAGQGQGYAISVDILTFTYSAVQTANVFYPTLASSNGMSVICGNGESTGTTIVSRVSKNGLVWTDIETVPAFTGRMTRLSTPNETFVLSQNPIYVLGNQEALITENVKIDWISVSSIELDAIQSCDYLIISNGHLDETVRTSILENMLYHPTNVSSYFFCDFDRNANGGNTAGAPFTEFAIYRYSESERALHHVCDTNPERGNVMIDSSAINGEKYTYYAFGIGSPDYVAAALTSGSVELCDWNWTLLSCSIDSAGVYHPQKIFVFGKNFASGDVSNNNAPQILQNFTQYPTVQTVPFNYKSGTLTSLIGTISDGKYSDTVNLRNEILALSTTRNTLFLKSRKGELLKVRVGAAVEYSTMDSSPTQAQTIKLPWVEVGDAEDSKIITTDADGAWPY